MAEGLVDWESRCKAAEARALESEKNMLQAASFGKLLLSQKEELERELKDLSEKVSSLQYNASMKEETNSLTLKSLESENESLRKELTQKEASWSREKEVLKSELRKAGQAHWNQLEEVNEEKEIASSETPRLHLLQEEIRILRKELDAVYASSSSKGDSFCELDPEEIARENEELKKRISLYKDEIEKVREENEEIKQEKTTLQHEIREKDEEILCYLQSLDSARNSAQDLHNEIETLQLGETDIKKGNSLFSEVEDRRNFVEQKLQVLQAKNLEMKKLIDEKSKQIHKVKMQNLALLNLGGSVAHDNVFSGSKSGSAQQVQRLEQQLSKEKQINKSLRDSLELISSSKASLGPQDESKKSDYAYMSSLLQEKANQIDEFKKQLQSQIRQTLEESDKVQDLSRKLNLQESQTVRLKAEVYQLKMMIEDLKAEKQQTPPVHKPKDKKKVIVEHITFEEESKVVKPPVLDVKNSLYELEEKKEDNKENLNNKSYRIQPNSSGIKKSVSMSQKVTVIDDDLNLEEDLKNEKLHKGLPRRTPKEQSAISVEEQDMEMKEKCAQQ